MSPLAYRRPFNGAAPTSALTGRRTATGRAQYIPPPAAESDCPTSAAALSDRIAPEDRDPGTYELKQPLNGKHCG
jgi:hypothetical protein